ncbi:hypothetical protein CKJ89_37790, partial [Klebsiella pneumoniae]
ETVRWRNKLWAGGGGDRWRPVLAKVLGANAISRLRRRLRSGRGASIGDRPLEKQAVGGRRW